MYFPNMFRFYVANVSKLLHQTLSIRLSKSLDDSSCTFDEVQRFDIIQLYDATTSIDGYGDSLLRSIRVIVQLSSWNNNNNIVCLLFC